MAYAFAGNSPYLFGDPTGAIFGFIDLNISARIRNELQLISLAASSFASRLLESLRFARNALLQLGGQIGNAASRIGTPFNPLGRAAGPNCVNAVCAFLNSVTERTLVRATDAIQWNGGLINNALNQIRGHVPGLRTGAIQSIGQMATANSRQFFIVFRGGSSTTSDHVLIGIVNNGVRMLYDPQSGQRFYDLAAFGPFRAIPVLLGNTQ